MRSTIKTILFFFLLISSSNLNAQQKEEKKIIAVLHEQDLAWNNGDLEAFMQTYWKNDSLMFIGKSGVTYGWQNTLNNYKRGYPDTASMGKLHFTLISIQKLSRKYYHVIGKWQLRRSVGNLQGHFTLVMKKIKGRWVIVADHSS
jgi:ketosteroid isomerase-like protein